MIAHQAIIGSFSLFGQLQPSLAFLEDLRPLEIEVAADDGLKAFGRVLDVVDHCKLDVAVPDDVCICLILLFSFESALFVLKAWLVEVDILTHDDGLNGDQYLKQGGDLGVPVFHGAASPSAQQTQAHLSA